jgi:fucose 4-O-acetylase-like acetyltransferase
MTYILFFFLALSITGINFAEPNKFNDDYMSKKQTTTINGIFVFLVFLSHGAQYISLDGAHNEVYVLLRRFLGQAVVTTFLFYSGFGMMSSIQKKSQNYIKEMPIKAFKLLIQFDVAVIFYLITNMFIDRNFPLKTILLSFTTWVSIGNSNWYITSMIIFCLLIGLAFTISRKNYFVGIILTTLFTILVVYFLMRIDRPAYTYNTMICLPAGMIFAYFKPTFDKLVKNDLTYLILILFTFIILSYSRIHITSGIQMYSIWSIFFAFSFVIFTKKIKLEHTFIEWLGNHIFSIYILQRLPMNILHYHGISTRHPFIVIGISFFSTLIIAILFDKYVMRIVNLVIDNLRKRIFHS